jgi:hypothetical protein
MPARRSFLLFGFLIVLMVAGGPAPLGAGEAADEDEGLLHKAAVPTDDAGLLAFLGKRSLSDGDLALLEQRVGQLGSKTFALRERATRELMSRGPAALRFLRQALQNTDPEVVRRARLCLAEIERDPRRTTAPAAAVRLLAQRNPPGTVAALLRFVPFTHDEALEEEVLNALASLSRPQGKADPALAAALKNHLPERRAAAAYVLGRGDDPDQLAAVRQLLDDTDPRVRLRAAQGLVAGRDKSAVPVLIALLADAPRSVAWQAEDLLLQIAEGQPPGAVLGPADAAARRKARDAWTAWWRRRGPRASLERVEVGPLGLAVVAELESNVVWECGPGGKPRWQLEDLAGPYDVQVLPGGRVLVAEYLGERITERDRTGKVLWQRPVKDPLSCQRLPGGNTLVTTVKGVLEIAPDGTEVSAYQPDPELVPLRAGHRLRDGRRVCVTEQPGLLILDADGKPAQVVGAATLGGVLDVEELPNGHFLATTSEDGKVMEVDAAGRLVWECTVNGAASATRLPNGHTLVACSTRRRLVRVDALGKVVWQKATDGRPFRVRRR